MKTLAFFFALMACIVSAAEDSISLPEITIKGQTYKTVTISLGAPYEAKINHQDGSKFIDAKLLPEDIRKRLGYDPIEAAKSAAYAAKSQAEDERKKQVAEAAVSLKQGSFSVRITVDSVLPNGLLGSAKIYTEKGEWVGEGIVLVETLTAGSEYLSDKTYKFTARKLGTYSYTTVLGSSKTVQKYRDNELILYLLAHPDFQLPE